MRPIFNKLFVLGNFAVFFVSLAVLLVVAAAISLLTLPDVGVMETCFTTAMYEVNLCPESEHYVKLKNISSYMVHAVIAAEDGSFYSHKGFDWHELKRSFDEDLASGQFHRGGSTLTQQLAKNLFLSREKNLWRKAKEAYLAHAIEKRYDKNFILEKYLNVVEFGENLYGVKDAAKKYFKKAPSDLTPLDAAWLAMLLPSPKKYSQSFRNGALTPFSRRMVGIILKRMQSFGKLSPAAYQVAQDEINKFPWREVTLAMFKEHPDYSLEATEIQETREVKQEDPPPDDEPHDLED